METANKVAVVTGANRGLGFEISRELCFAGFTVYMCGRNSARIQQAAGLLRGEGHRVIPIEVDVSKIEHIQRFAKRLEKENVEVHAVVNNAAVRFDWKVSILEIEYELAVQTVLTNTIAPLYFTRAMLPFMKSGARIVMMSSTASTISNGSANGEGTYSMSKTGLNTITRHLAPELEERGIVVSVASPGLVGTDLGEEKPERSTKEGAKTPVWLATEIELDQTGHFWQDKKIIPW